MPDTLRNVWESTSALTVSGDYRVGDIRHNWSDNSLLKTYLPEWEPTSLSAGLKEFVKWAKTQEVFDDTSQLATDELRTRDLGRT